MQDEIQQLLQLCWQRPKVVAKQESLFVFLPRLLNDQIMRYDSTILKIAFISCYYILDKALAIG